MGNTLSSVADGISKILRDVDLALHGAFDRLLAVQHAINSLATKDILHVLLDEEDRVKFQTLHARMHSFAVAVQLFANTSALRALLDEEDRAKFRTEPARQPGLLMFTPGPLKKKIELVAKCLPDQAIASLNGFDREDTVDEASELQQCCRSLRSDYADFMRHIGVKYASKAASFSAAESRKRILKLVGLASFSVACIVCFVLPFTPAAPAAVSALSIPAKWGIAVALSSGAVSSGAAAAAVCMNKGEVERAIEFLNNIDDFMKAMKKLLAALRKYTITRNCLIMWDRPKFQCTLICPTLACSTARHQCRCDDLLTETTYMSNSGIIMLCDEIVAACQKL